MACNCLVGEVRPTRRRMSEAKRLRETPQHQKYWVSAIGVYPFPPRQHYRVTNTGLPHPHPAIKTGHCWEKCQRRSNPRHPPTPTPPHPPAPHTHIPSGYYRPTISTRHQKLATVGQLPTTNPSSPRQNHGPTYILV